MTAHPKNPFLVAALLIAFIEMPTAPAGQAAATSTSAAPARVEAQACNPATMTSTERARHRERTRALRTSVLQRTELRDGTAFRIDPTVLPFLDLAGWVDAERRCCPFATFLIRLTRDGGPVWLEVTGPEGTREIIHEALADG